MNSNRVHTFFNKQLVCCLCAFFLVLSGIFLLPTTPQAHALSLSSICEFGSSVSTDSVTGTATSKATGAIGSSGKVPVYDDAVYGKSTLIYNSLDKLVTKETKTDGICTTLAKVALGMLTDSIVNWIDSGFNGSPSFVSNFGNFLVNIADTTAGTFISDTLGAKFLCEPFKFNVRLNLALKYTGRYSTKARCTLSDMGKNIKNAISNASVSVNTSLTWDEWYDMTQNPQNNHFGAEIMAESELEASITTKSGQQVKLLDWGSGFKSATKNGSITTPGVTISNSLSGSIKSNYDELGMADEVDKVSAALLRMLVTNIIQKGFGTGETFTGSDIMKDLR